jgi:6-pyruvoyl-tetrahydropterin synthase
LERAHEQKKSLDLAGITKRLKDYEQMLQHYILMRTKNKMKDSEAESEEWWEVVKEYFTKELENNLVQHTADERILMYNLEAYYKKIQISSMAIQQVQRYRATMNR